jgi:hypothetical protein
LRLGARITLSMRFGAPVSGCQPRLVTLLGFDEDLKRSRERFSFKEGRGRSRSRGSACKREHLPLVLTLLGDIGDPKYEAELRRLSDDPEACRGSRQSALHVLKAQKGRR